MERLHRNLARQTIRWTDDLRLDFLGRPTPSGQWLKKKRQTLRISCAFVLQWDNTVIMFIHFARTPHLYWSGTISDTMNSHFWLGTLHFFLYRSSVVVQESNWLVRAINQWKYWINTTINLFWFPRRYNFHSRRKVLNNANACISICDLTQRMSVDRRHACRLVHRLIGLWYVVYCRIRRACNSLIEMTKRGIWQKAGRSFFDVFSWIKRYVSDIEWSGYFRPLIPFYNLNHRYWNSRSFNNGPNWFLLCQVAVWMFSASTTTGKWYRMTLS